MLKLSLLSGILGPFDCLFFQLTIIHKVNSYFLKTKQTTSFTQGKDENHLWCHLQQLTRVTTFQKQIATLTSSLKLTFYAVVNMRGLLLDVRLWTFVPQRSAPFLRPWTSSSGGYFGMFFFLLFHQGRPNLRLFNQLYWVLFSSVNIITVWQDFG